MKPFVFLLAVFVAAPLCAQVFPKTDKDKVSEDIERARKNGEQPDTPPKDSPKDPPKAVDGAAALARFQTLREGMRKQESSESRESAKVLDQYHDAVSGYLAAHAALKAGFYKEASRAFKKCAVPSDEELKGYKGEVRARVVELQAGRHFYYRMIADVLSYYAYSENDGEFDRTWTRAEKHGQTVVKELQQAILRKQIDETMGGITLRRLENWLKEERGHWGSLRDAEKALNENPGEITHWTRYLNVVSARERDDATPDFISARAALTVIKEYWPQDSLVRRGNIDAGLAWVFTALYQFERANAALDGATQLSEEGVRYVEDQRRRIQEVQNAANREYKK